MAVAIFLNNVFQLRTLDFVFRWAVIVGLGWPFFAAAAEPASTNGLQTVEAIRNLTMAQTEEQIPVRLHGVITFFEESLYSRFMQDSTAGIYLQFPANTGPPPLTPGQAVEVTGTCSPGEYAPVVVVKHIEVLGEAPFPTPVPIDYQRLASGVEDSQFIQISGIVRSVKPLENSLYNLIEIATGGGRLMVCAKDLPVQNTDELLDSTVRVRAVCSTKFNHQRQLFDIRLMVPRPQDLKITMPAPKDPFAIPARPIGSLLQFTPKNEQGHRVKVIGTVIYFAAGESIFLQDSEHGVEVQTTARTPLQLGDKIEVLGFIGPGAYTPVLRDAAYQRISSGLTPVPIVLTPNEALKGNYDSRLIEVSAKLVDRNLNGAERYLILQADGFIFHAYLKQPEGVDPFSGLANGSRIAVRGVCRIDPGDWQAGEAWRAKSFGIELRSTTDINFLQAPPWWTRRRVLWMAGAFGLAALAAFAWVAALRRQVTERTRQLEIQIQERQRAERRREIEQERARVAHDLHDDLGAGLTEVNILSSLVKSPTTSPKEKQNYLERLNETALRMVTSLDEIVWAVNPRNDTVASLSSYFGSYAQRLLDLGGVACGLDIADDLPDHALEPKFRQQIFFAFKEALTNVMRHAHASQVWLRVSIRNQFLRVEVADNGCGFVGMEEQNEGDGLKNMKERLQSLAGTCQITSKDGQGTVVIFSAPLPKALL